jgi:hypothetical protein
MTFNLFLNKLNAIKPSKTTTVIDINERRIETMELNPILIILS